MFGLKIKQSKYIKEVDWLDITNIATDSYDASNYLQNEFIGLIRKAEEIYSTKRRKKNKSD